MDDTFTVPALLVRLIYLSSCYHIFFAVTGKAKDAIYLCMFSSFAHFFTSITFHRHANVCVTASIRLISLMFASLNQTYVRMEFCAGSRDSPAFTVVLETSAIE